MATMPNGAQPSATSDSHLPDEPMQVDSGNVIKPEVIPIDVVPDPQCHDVLWHEDGNVVIVTVSMLFRVHQNTLCDQSSVLKALVVLSQAEQKSDEANGTQCQNQNKTDYIQLNDDPADVEQLLFSLYDPKCVRLPLLSLCICQTYAMMSRCVDPAQVSFMHVSVWLRLGTKYKVAHLRDEAIRRLSVCYPTTLQAFDLVNSHSFTPPIEQPTMPEASMVVFLALKHDLTHVLPTALYYCCLEKPSSLSSIIFLLVWRPTTPRPPSLFTIVFLLCSSL